MLGLRQARQFAREAARCEQAARFWDNAGDTDLSAYYQGAGEAYVHVLFGSSLPIDRVRQEMELARLQTTIIVAAASRREVMQ